jgi:hypothetical protein
MAHAPSELSALTDAAMALHGLDPVAAASRLRDDARPLLPDADCGDLDALLRSAEHVLLGHQDDAEALHALAAAVGEQRGRCPALATSLQRLTLACRLASLVSPPAADLTAGLPPAEHIRAHYNAALALTRRDDLAGARRLMDSATNLASANEDDARAQRAIAALCNNLAADLRQDLPAAAPERTALMIEAATLARVAWARVGGWLEIERADWQLAMCHARAGQGLEALPYARAGLAACEAHAADDYEFCFAWQALALAALAAHDVAQAHQAREHMALRCQRLVDPGDAAYADACLVEIDARLAG